MERSAVGHARAKEKNETQMMTSQSAVQLLSELRTWWKLLCIDRNEEVHSLESCPMVCACYCDARGLTFEIYEEYDMEETRQHIYEQLDLLNSDVAMYVHVDNVFLHGSKQDTARSYLHRIYNRSKEAMLTGVVQSRFMCEIGITVGHLFNDHDQEVGATGEYKEVELGGGLSGYFYGNKLEEVVVDGKTFTADIAAIYFPPSPNNPICFDHLNKTDINGQIFQCKWCMKDESSILPGTEVWMINQDGDLKIGKVCRLLLYDKLLKLHNVMQIVSENSRESFSKEGDSGCRIFLPPSGAEHVIHVIGTVISEVTYETLKLTNAIWLGKVLPAFLRTLSYSSSKGPFPLCRHDNLPVGLDFTEGLEFSGLAGEFGNLSVESLYSEYDSGIVVEDSSKELGPGSGLFDCTPVECSDDCL